MAQPIQGNARRQRRRFAPTSGRASDAQSSEWLWGWHAVIAALENPARAQPKRLLATAERARTIQQRLGDLPWLEVVAAATISELTPRGAVHQGLALRAAPIEATHAKAKAALGAKFDIRRFHDAALLNGAMPLKVLETVIDDYIARTQAA